MTRERLQQYKAKMRRNLCSNCSLSSRKKEKLTRSPLQLGLIPTEVSCQEQIHKPRTKHTSGHPGLDEGPMYLGEELSTEQTPRNISPEHFPSNLTTCCSMVSRARGRAFVFNSPYLINDIAELPLEPP